MNTTAVLVKLGNAILSKRSKQVLEVSTAAVSLAAACVHLGTELHKRAKVKGELDEKDIREAVEDAKESID